LAAAVGWVAGVVERRARTPNTNMLRITCARRGGRANPDLGEDTEHHHPRTDRWSGGRACVGWAVLPLPRSASCTGGGCSCTAKNEIRGAFHFVSRDDGGHPSPNYLNRASSLVPDIYLHSAHSRERPSYRSRHWPPPPRTTHACTTTQTTHIQRAETQT
jgi:hypothetical protein